MKPHLLGMLPNDLVRAMASAGVPVRDVEARRFLAHKVSGDPLMRPPSKRVLAALDEHTTHAPLEIVERVADPHDGFVKYLFKSPDGALTEAVRIPLHKKGAFTVCLSSQVGCAMRCDFCATGRLGLTRNLEAWEIVSAFCIVRDEARELGRVTGAVFMGQGEPFHNYDAVIQAAKVLSDPCGGRIAGEAITISTVGLVPQIRRYTREGHRYRVIVSLTSAVEEKRRRLLPVAGRIPLAELREAVHEHHQQAKGRMTLAWVVMSGVNTGDDEIAPLVDFVGDMKVRMNLIDVNDAREDGYVRAEREELKELLDKLQVLKAPLVRRYSGGAQKHAACGMLAATRFGDEA